MEERGRDFIATIFAKRDLDDICESEAIEHCADGVSNVEHQHSQAAVRLVGARAPCVGCSTNAPDWRQRSFKQPNDGAKFYPAHRPRQRVPAEFSAPAFHVSGRLELHKNLLEKFDRQFFFRGELAYLKHRPAEFGGNAEIDKRSERVFATFRKFHALLQYRAAVYGMAAGDAVGYGIHQCCPDLPALPPERLKAQPKQTRPQ
jgi:hypothetical protein